MTLDRTLEAAAQQAMADLANSGGGTYEAGTFLPFKPENGYAVGIGGIAMKATNVQHADTMAWLMKNVAGEYMTAYVGTWLDEGVVYVDGVVFCRDINYARTMAREHEQKAFYGFAEKESINVD